MLGISSSLSSKKHVKKHVNTSLTCVAASSDKIEVANHADFRVNSAHFSACFWVKITADAESTSNKDGYIGIQAGAFRGNGFYFWYDDAAGDSEKIKFITNTGSASNNIASGDIDHDVWHHVAATFNTSVNVASLFIDGILAQAGVMVDPTDYTGTVYIGNSDVSSNHVDCITSEVAFWNGRLLTTDQIEEIYSERPDLELYHPIPTCYWRLDENSATGTDGVIESIQGLHGTSTNLADTDFDTADTPTGV